MALTLIDMGCVTLRYGDEHKELRPETVESRKRHFDEAFEDAIAAAIKVANATGKDVVLYHGELDEVLAVIQYDTGDGVVTRLQPTPRY